MENLFSPLSTNITSNTTTITTNATKPNMSFSQNSPLSSICGPLNYPSTSSTSSPPDHSIPPPFQTQVHTSQFSPFYPFWFLQNGIEIQRSYLLQPNGFSIDQERRVLDAYKTKVARSKRKLARQRSLIKNSSSGVNSAQMDIKKPAFNGASTNVQDSQGNINKDLYTFCTLDNKKLRVLLTKELKNSDVGSLGRIVLPKRDTEENLPILSEKEGIQVVLIDVNTNQEWSLKFKYWSNNKSRMYVLENTGDFVKQNGMESGDSLTLYEDESKNLYFSIKKVETQEAEPFTNQSYLYIPNACHARDEEEASFALLMEQLKHKEQQEEEANSLVTLSMDIGSSYRHKEEEKNGRFFNNVTSIGRTSSSAQSMDDHFILDDCYNGLDILPDVNRYNFQYD
ncbi:hypothetical protein JCGZ_21456 [Jatropha curcas]|uniref:TF-B3 domain-containing protein n=1 Tax=Jatropha curcas TaxID=180498 RepID=A0A067JLU7_JATCU|nr:B3 domain-containing transcription factor LEC2 [Jatropha curcas]KDP20985.1 hypothetical protein JCGZ_21456 [Jatropha curcas]